MRLDFRQFDTVHLPPLKITVNGLDVSARCFLVDTDQGEAHCYKSTEHLILDESGNLATEVLTGEVEVRQR